MHRRTGKKNGRDGKDQQNEIGGQLLGEGERGWRIAGAVSIAIGVAALAMAR